MSTINIFDPAMCCSSGVCGPKPDQKLSVFSADLGHLETLGHQVTRHNLAQEPAAFAANSIVRSMLESHQTQALPIILRDGVMVSYGKYPSRSELEKMAAGEVLELAAAPKSCSCHGGC